VDDEAPLPVGACGGVMGDVSVMINDLDLSPFSVEIM